LLRGRARPGDECAGDPLPAGSVTGMPVRTGDTGDADDGELPARPGNAGSTDPSGQTRGLASGSTPT